MKKHTTPARIVAIILALLMVLSAAAVVFGVLAGNAGAAELSAAPIPNTGIAEDWIFYVLGGAVLLATACIFLPRVIKKKPPKDDDDDEF
ncbi:MAG: LPXTG cell wall anchor domain-containing protein [Oscillospiraceae bacterium]|jgi:LPXTG-motif cell wall-anchored protein|nr:LPXTG cell wall anchor domain-containing protein [Oscillospiraceae bacterium]